MNTVLFMMIITTLISTILTMLGYWLPINIPNAEKLSPYECGFDPLGSARLPFSIRFFLIAILFLLFDLEIALLLPTLWAAQTFPMNMFMWSTIILMLLTLGLVYEWYQGGLEWAE
uniref:NADH-ubiquinone oxidoreductase chain 3 n=1 Tax=Plethodon shenandoah TaxID=141978 RepID=A0A4Y5P4H9_9SALA|nr:NADH dehydrogenase subunit 3 [Plethodon shenandoah]QCW57868.1 NADH dehydrogenase subunit 3 [Plethodon shenandoah]QCW57881.1 NADH dehydrogenase subunit 3 [Plethodon shenandoah]QCW57894.1 NADH dehydrogenase subunit 3 [Plethodon shenandoah]QCW57907.1 NADH dehydrogenase subunit 3 [Plethodon shenandoah]